MKVRAAGDCGPVISSAMANLVLVTNPAWEIEGRETRDQQRQLDQLQRTVDREVQTILTKDQRHQLERPPHR